MNIFELTRKLIDIPSVTGDEKAVGEFLASHLRSLGYHLINGEPTDNRLARATKVL